MFCEKNMNADEFEQVKKFENRNQARVDFLVAWPNTEALIEKNFSIIDI